MIGFCIRFIVHLSVAFLVSVPATPVAGLLFMMVATYYNLRKLDKVNLREIDKINRRKIR